MYDKIIERYHGNIIGISHESIKLDDGKYYDVKEYELFKRDYERNKNNKENKIKCHIKKTEKLIHILNLLNIINKMHL